MTEQRLWIMIAGPYSSCVKTEEERQRNLDVLNRAALEVFEKGHVPIIGVNNALPLILLSANPNAFENIMMPLSLALSERCDACLRVGGPSQGADAEVERFRATGRPVYFDINEVPKIKSLAQFSE